MDWHGRTSSVEFAEAGLRRSLATYGSLISACGNALQWQAWWGHHDDFNRLPQLPEYIFGTPYTGILALPGATADKQAGSSVQRMLPSTIVMIRLCTAGLESSRFIVVVATVAAVAKFVIKIHSLSVI